MKTTSTKKLHSIATQIRIETIKMLAAAGSGHTASSLGLADFFVAMYFAILQHNPENPNWPGRDRLILSCGHVTPVRYAAMALAGYFPKKELKTLRRLGSKLQGHPSYLDLPALESSSGPLGQGASIAIGKALAAKLKKQNHFIYLLMSDGEQQEGQVWEAAMAAAHYKLDNLIAFVDLNKIQISGEVKNVMSIKFLSNKYKSFNWYVQEVDGNNISAIEKAVNIAKNVGDRPSVIMLNTIPGYGIKEIEGDYKWHGKVPSGGECEKWLENLEFTVKS